MTGRRTSESSLLAVLTASFLPKTDVAHTFFRPKSRESKRPHSTQPVPTPEIAPGSHLIYVRK